MHSGLFYWQSVFISEADLLGWLVLVELCLANINNKPVKTFYLKIEKLLNLRQGRHDTTHLTHILPILEIGKTLELFQMWTTDVLQYTLQFLVLASFTSNLLPIAYQYKTRRPNLISYYSHQIDTRIKSKGCFEKFRQFSIW